jgi:Domain of unknown function (DUF4411)
MNTTTDVIWVIDTSSIAQVRRSIENAKKPGVFAKMGALVQCGRLLYTKQVVAELERVADPASPDPQYLWAKLHEAAACQPVPSLAEIKAVLAAVPSVLDPDKDSGAEEADPYLLAVAVQLRVQAKDSRIVSEEIRETPRKTSLRTAAGLLGVPSVSLKAFLEFEGIA